MQASLAEALDGLEAGYCLWVGAGLTCQVSGDPRAMPQWGDLTAEVERRADLGVAPGLDFPSRLQRCADVLGAEFARHLRQRYVTDLCVRLLREADELLDSAGEPRPIAPAQIEADREPFARAFLPTRLKAVAALGQLANPIVSFNVEWLSSLLLARPGGPIRLAYNQPLYRWREPSSRHQRLVYHPHGLADATPVMTVTDYARLEQDLAFAVAVHAAFQNQLAIVGMSLDDEYLKRHIEQFRDGIVRIYWFNSDFAPGQAEWADAHDVTMVRSSWPAFWDAWAGVGTDLTLPDAASAWYMAVDSAATEAEGGPLGALGRALDGLDDVPPDLARMAGDMARRGLDSGEPGRQVLVDGRPAREIELRLRHHLSASGLPTPSVAKTM